MTILSASQAAIAQLVGRRPAAVVSSNEEICVEVTAIAQEAAMDIAKAFDWQKLTKFHTVTADGTTSSFPMPDDYDRMVQATDLYDPQNWAWNYQHVTDPGDWIQLTNSGFGLLSPGMWTMLGGEFRFLPVPGSGQSAIFPYISNIIFRDRDGNPKTELTRDDDVFVLDERVLKLAIIWRWLALKRMDYQQEMEDYNISIDQEMTRDKGARVIRKNHRRPMHGMSVAWPWPLGQV